MKEIPLFKIVANNFQEDGFDTEVQVSNNVNLKFMNEEEVKKFDEAVEVISNFLAKGLQMHVEEEIKKQKIRDIILN